jgi:hypothetical protein
MPPRLYRSGFLGTRFIGIEVCRLSSVHVPGKEGGSWEAARPPNHLSSLGGVRGHFLVEFLFQRLQVEARAFLHRREF